MDNFENKMIKGIHVSRYVASWISEGGSLNGAWDDELDDIHYPFERWLKSIPFDDGNGNIVHISDEEAKYIMNFATNGKMELEMLAGEFIKNMKD